MTEREEPETIQYSFIEGSKAVLLQGPLNILLVCIPLCLISNFLGWSEGITFTFALLALAPIAERLGFVTEQLAIHTNETIGGLLNATFGNATELIVAIAALNKGLFRLVQLSLLGSILSNMLLVLGMAFFCGGLRHRVQTFNKISSQVNSTLLMLSTAGVMLPTVLTLSGEESRMGELGFSRYASILLFVSYFAFLYFQVNTIGIHNEVI
jgi:Ca2+:H+ antiporter